MLLFATPKSIARCNCRGMIPSDSWPGNCYLLIGVAGHNTGSISTKERSFTMMSQSYGWMQPGAMWAILAVLVVAVVVFNKIFRNK